MTMVILEREVEATNPSAMGSVSLSVGESISRLICPCSPSIVTTGLNLASGLWVSRKNAVPTSTLCQMYSNKALILLIIYAHYHPKVS